MQFRPSLSETFTLKQRFNGRGMLGNREFWVQTGNFLNFEGGRNRLHRHSYYEACLVLDGRGTFSHGDAEYRLRRGDLFIADPGVVHEIISHPAEHLKIQFLSFSFEEPETDETLQDGSITAFTRDHRILAGECERFEELFRMLKEASLETNPARSYLKNITLISLIIQEIILALTEGPDHDKALFIGDSRIQNALQYMKDNVFRRLSVEEIASHAGASPRSLRRLIKEHYDMTVAQKSFSLRIESAARYLVSHPDKTVAEVSVVYGFENPSDFCRGFRKVTGSSPGRYRENKGTAFL